MIIVGVHRADGTFSDDVGKEIIYDNVYVHAVSTDADEPDRDYSLSVGKFVESWKIKTDLFLKSFKDMKDPYTECIGKDVLPFYSKRGNNVVLTAFIRR